MLSRIALALIGCVGISQASANTIVVGSGAYADCSFGCTDVVQQVYSAGLFPGPVEITGVSFFADPTSTDTGWTGNSTWQMSLSTSQNGPGTLSRTFSANVGANNAVFGSLTPSGSPNAGAPVSFSGSFDYNPASGPLLVNTQLVSGPLVGTEHLAAGYNPGLTDRAVSQSGYTFADGVNQGGYILQTEFEFTPLTTLTLNIAYTAFFTGPGSDDILKFVVPTGAHYYLTFDQNPSDVAYSVSINGRSARVYKLPQYAIGLQPGVYSILFTDLGYDPSVTFDLSSTLPNGFPLANTPLPAALPLFATGLGALGLLRWRRKRKAAALAA